MDLKNISFRLTCIKNGLMVLERGSLKIDSDDQKVIRLLRIRDNNQTHRAVAMYFHIAKSDVVSESSSEKEFCVSLRRGDEVTFIVTATYGQDDSHVVLCENIRYPSRYKKGSHASPSKKDIATASKKDTATVSDEIGIEYKEYNTAKRVTAEPFLGGLGLMLEWDRAVSLHQDPTTSPTRDSDIEEEIAQKKADPSITIIIAKCYINTAKLDRMLSSSKGFHSESSGGRIQNVKEVTLASLRIHDPDVPTIEDVTSLMTTVQDAPKQPPTKRHQHEKKGLEKRRKSDEK